MAEYSELYPALAGEWSELCRMCAVVFFQYMRTGSHLYDVKRLNWLLMQVEVVAV